jgi:hypothetical protein
MAHDFATGTHPRALIDRVTILSPVFVLPFAVGLSMHGLIQNNTWMFMASAAGPALVLAMATGPSLRAAARGTLAVFAAFALAAAVWHAPVVRLGLGLVSVAVGLAVMLRLASPAAGVPRGQAVRRHQLVWCYALGPPSAVALYVLAAQSQQFGTLRDVIYLVLGRAAAVVGVFYWIVVERALHVRYRSTSSVIPDGFLPFRILVALLGLTGFLMPGGGSPYSFFWALAWFILAGIERRHELC